MRRICWLCGKKREAHLMVPLPISISDPAYRRLAIRINKRWLFMTEEDIDWIISSVLKTKAIVDRRPKNEVKK